MSTLHTDLGLARELAKRILTADRPRVRRIILFGSRARGDARPDSDLDLLVVIDHAPARGAREVSAGALPAVPGRRRPGRAVRHERG